MLSAGVNINTSSPSAYNVNSIDIDAN